MILWIFFLQKNIMRIIKRNITLSKIFQKKNHEILSFFDDFWADFEFKMDCNFCNFLDSNFR